MKNLWVAEYSQSQQAYHRDELRKVLELNLTRMINDNNPGDWVILGIGSFEDMGKLINIVKDRVKK